MRTRGGQGIKGNDGSANLTANAAVAPARVRETFDPASMPVRFLFNYDNQTEHLSIGDCSGDVATRNAIRLALTHPRAVDLVAKPSERNGKRCIVFSMPDPDCSHGSRNSGWQVSVFAEHGKVVKVDIVNQRSGFCKYSSRFSPQRSVAASAGGPAPSSVGSPGSVRAGGTLAARLPPDSALTSNTGEPSTASRATPPKGNRSAGRRLPLAPAMTSNRKSSFRLTKSASKATGVRQSGPPALPIEHTDRIKDFGWIRNSDQHTFLVVPSGRLTDARCLVDELFRSTGKETLYLNDPQVQDEFMSSLSLDQLGKPRLAPGPFLERMKQGGVVLINAEKYSRAQLDAFNTVMEEGLYDGEPLENPPRIVIMCDEATAQKRPVSGPQLSRTQFVAMDSYDFPHYVFPPIQPATVDRQEDASYIDLGFQSGSSSRFREHVGIDRHQNWAMVEGLLGPADSRHALVLRNLPTIEADPYVWDYLRGLIASGRPVRIEDDLPAKTIADLVQNKAAADGFAATIARPDAAVCVVNSANIEQTLASHHGIHEGFPILRPSLLHQAKAAAPEQALTVYVPERLAPFQWDQLMQHSLSFQVAASDTAQVPPRYADRVHVVTKEDVAGSADPAARVRIRHCPDPVLSDRIDGENDVARIFVTPSMSAEELLSSTLQQAGPVEQQAADLPRGRTNFVVILNEMVQQLMQGNTVKLFGLEQNPELEAELATLLHPPHYIDHNGKRLHFGPGGELTGKLQVLSRSADLIERHPLAASTVEPFDEKTWRKSVLQKLAEKFHPMSAEAIEKKAGAVIRLYEELRHRRLVDGSGPPVSYARLETLFKYLFNGIEDSLDQADPRVRERQVRGLYKSLLISDLQSGSGNQDKLYAELKIWLRTLFPAEMNVVPPGHVDTRRLQKLLKQVNHEKDVLENAWQFLNVFGLDTIHAQIGANLSRSRQEDEKVAASVLKLVMEQAQCHKLELPARLQARQQKILGAQFVARPLPAYVRPSRLTLEQRDHHLSQALADQGSALFLKGSPGGGKTRQVGSLKQGKRIDLDIAQEGTADFSARVMEWASHAGPATLIIDEANLATAGALDMFKGMFIDGSIHVNGRLFKLTDGHKIIFTGNGDHFPGRRSQAVATEWMPTMQFKGVPDTALSPVFIEPLLAQAAKTIAPLQHEHVRVAMTATALKIHKHLKLTFPDLGLSPRNLEELLVQALTLLADHPDLVNGANIDAWMARLAMDVYCADLQPVQRSLCDAWLTKTWEMEAGLGLPTLPDYDLKTAHLAKTDSTQTLINKLALRFSAHERRMQFDHKNRSSEAAADANTDEPVSVKHDTLGQPAIIIDAAASRGKDSVVCAMLAQMGKAYRHINIEPDNLGAFHDALIDAYTTGKALVVSELNLLPSDIVESELNALLTGQSGHVRHRDFMFIGTMNPVSYGGRQLLSPALINRSSFMHEPDYQPDELLPIASKIVKRVNDEMDPRLARLMPPPDNMAQLAADVVERHLVLSRRLAGGPDEYRPGIRQIAMMIKDLRTRSSEPFEQLFEKNYASYLGMADMLEQGGSIGKSGAASVAANLNSKARVLKNLMMLDQAEWLSYPALQPRRRHGSGSPAEILKYDGVRHTIFFDPDCSDDELATAMLKLLRRGLVNPASSFNPAQGAMQVDAPVFVSPVHPQSGVGEAYQPQFFGHVQTDEAGLDLLSTGDVLLEGETDTAPFERFADPDDTHKPLASVRVEDAPVIALHGKHLVGLARGENLCPADVEIDGKKADIYRQGSRWYAEVPVTAQQTVELRYKQVWANEITMAGEISSPGRWEVDLHGQPELKSQLARLGEDAHDLYRSEQIAQLGQIFARSFQYGDDEADALKATDSHLARVQRMLDGRVGVCAEIAMTFKMLGENLLGFPISLVAGHQIKGEKIDGTGHLWVKYADESGAIHWFDPTALIPLSDQFDAQVDAFHRNQPGNRAGAGAAHSGSSSNSVNTSIADLRRSVPALSDSHSVKGFPLEDKDVISTLDTDALAHFDPDRLGLVHVEMERQGKNINGKKGALYPKGILAGRPDQMFIDTAIRARDKVKDIVFEEMVHPDSAADLAKFQMILGAPFEALQMSGARLYGYNKNGRQIELERLADLQSGSHKPVGLAQEQNPGRFAIHRGNEEIFGKLADEYYGGLLTAKQIDIEDTEAVKACLYDQWRKIIVRNELDFPLEFRLMGKEIRLTAAEFKRNHQQWIQHADLTTADQTMMLFQLLDLKDDADSLEWQDESAAYSQRSDEWDDDRMARSFQASQIVDNVFHHWGRRSSGYGDDSESVDYASSYGSQG